MRKISTLILMLAFAMNAFCQQNTVTDVKIEKDRYLRKSKTQKTVAWVLAGTGTAIIIATAVSASGNKSSGGGWFDFSGLNRTLNTWSYLTGGVFVAGSVPLFLAAANNKAKAAQLGVFIGTEPIPQFSLAGYSVKTIPAAGVRISF